MTEKVCFEVIDESDLSQARCGDPDPDIGVSDNLADVSCQKCIELLEEDRRNPPEMRYKKICAMVIDENDRSQARCGDTDPDIGVSEEAWRVTCKKCVSLPTKEQMTPAYEVVKTIISDLLEELESREWEYDSGEQGGGGKSSVFCRSCGVNRPPNEYPRVHKEGCELAALIARAHQNLDAFT